jgi:hypothetical protein
MRYLLGNLSEDEKIRMEDAFFADDSKFEDLELAEDELIDAYVRNELSPEEQQQFKAKLLGSKRLRERVNFAGTLAEKADSFHSAIHSLEPELSFRSPSAKSGIRWKAGFFAPQPAWRTAVFACASLILVAGVVLFSGWLRLRNESQRLASERLELQHQKEELEKLSGAQPTTEQLTAQLQREREQRAEDLKRIEELQQANPLKEQPTRGSALATIATVLLTPGSLRGSGGSQSQLLIRPETTAARVQLALDKNEYPTYSATIKTADETVVFRKNHLRAHATRSGPQLLLSLPSRLLHASDDYIVHVDGVIRSGQLENVNDYQFRVKSSK